MFRPNPHLRPTADKVRKAVMDMLQGRLEGAKVLDLFSGTGALGLEALSNGALCAIFVELDKFQARVIQENLVKLKLNQQAEVIVSDAFKAVEKISRDGEIFDIVFVDPPYEWGERLRCLECLASSGVVKKEGIVVLEVEISARLPKESGSLKQIKEKKYGDTRILIYKSSGMLYC